MQKITATNFNQLVEQLNQNFSELIASEIFKGLPGNQGLPGAGGGAGIRGSQFTYIDVAQLNIEFSSIYEPDDITGILLNALAVADLQKVVNSTTLTAFVANDMVILPNGQIWSWDGAVFVYTGVDLVTPDEAISYQDALQILQSNTLAGSGAYTTFILAHKKFKDTDDDAPLNSQTIYPDSILDVQIPTAVAGTNEDTALLMGPQTGLAVQLAQNQAIVNVSGHVSELYDMVQNVLVTSLAQTVDQDTQMIPSRLPSNVVLQNDYESGIAIGHRLSSSLAKFGSIHMLTDNVLQLSGKFGIPALHTEKVVIGEDIGGFLHTSLYGERVRLKATGRINIEAPQITPGRILEVDALGLLLAGKESQNILSSGYVSAQGTLPGYNNTYTFVTSDIIQDFVDTKQWNWYNWDPAHMPKWYDAIYYDWTEYDIASGSDAYWDLPSDPDKGIAKGGWNKALPKSSTYPDIPESSFNVQSGIYVITRVVAPSLGRLMRRLREARFQQFGDRGDSNPIVTVDNPHGNVTTDDWLRDFGGVSGVWIKRFTLDGFCIDNPLHPSCLATPPAPL